MKTQLDPIIEDLRLECVLMQAWKKTSSYLRTHSWYADTLGIDYESLRIPRFIREIQDRLQDPFTWTSKPLELVPAPKNQKWVYHDEKWEPSKKEKDFEKKVRPLAHLDLQDQVVATAIALCLADRVENTLGDPRLPIKDEENRRRVLAYGHRLFCDTNKENKLIHRWGTSKLYRQYFQDYQTFLQRPKVVVSSITNNIGYEIAIIQSDLSKFYDRVRPMVLHEKVCNFENNSVEDDFFNFAKIVLDWRWADKRRAERYSREHGIVDFGLVALPQGLVTAGFYANIFLSDFDNALRESIGKNLPSTDMILYDICYYVDDFRIVLKIPEGMNEDAVKYEVVNWLNSLLNHHASSLRISEEKTLVTIEGREKRFLVRQSREANRIQRQVSDTFDMLHGTELIAAIEGFFHTQKRYSVEQEYGNDKDKGLLVGVPDMRDDTAARFAAGKFRRTFRSLRPLLLDVPTTNMQADDNEETILPQQLVFTKSQLDERAKFFAAILIEEWIRNPGNVRLLRIALDMYPDSDFLCRVLEILRPVWKSCKYKKARKEIRIYCLAEIFRAGATETGFVEEDECLPEGVSIDDYHDLLTKEACDLADTYLRSKAPDTRFPWYLMQQVFLYLATRNSIPPKMATSKSRGGRLLSQYWNLAKFMSGKLPSTLEQRAIFLTILKTSYGLQDFSSLTSIVRLSDKFLAEVERISPPVASELWMRFKNTAGEQITNTAQRLGLESVCDLLTEDSLADVCKLDVNPFYEEENLLQLAYWLLSQIQSYKAIVTPWNICCRVITKTGYEFGKIDPEYFKYQKVTGRASHLFKPPDWCESDEARHKFQVGIILRFALRGSTGFYHNFCSQNSNKRVRYQRSVSHWEQQRYSSYQGRDAFGPAWLPISSFTENLLFELLRWPGSGILKPQSSIEELLGKVLIRLTHLQKQRGTVTSVTFLEQEAPYPYKPIRKTWQRPLRIGIVQSITPNLNDYENNINNPQLTNDLNLRTRQRGHLSAIMEGVAQMLRVRDTHQYVSMNDLQMDLLIFPELFIHPNDINTRVLPFVRKHRCLALFGQVYHPKTNNQSSPLINSVLWMIPEWNVSRGLQIKRIEQGKKNLTKTESGFTPQPISFRPAQWLIEYQWHSNTETHRPLIITASICYDATDIELAADLRKRSDLYIVCALNSDVGTFDRMSEGLHYHMYQGIIIVNNGEYGGSNFFMPFQSQHNRQILHLHGQPQASIAFVEIDPETLINRQNKLPNIRPRGTWKMPPAGWDSF
ncbi:MAG: RNA-directed DNA polymerase [Syntrophales bacterium]